MMVRLSYAVLVVITIIVLGSTYYVSSSTTLSAQHRTAVYNAVSDIQNSYYELKVELLTYMHTQGKDKQKILTLINNLEKAKKRLLELDSSIIQADIINTEISFIKQKVKELKQLKNAQELSQLDIQKIDNALNGNLLEVLRSIEFNYDLQQRQTRENVFSFQKVIVALFVLLVGVAIYFIYFNNKERKKLFRLQKNLQNSLVTDTLTGLGNRLAISRLFRKNKTPLTVVMFNIAKFKHINDFYGVNVGDHVLKAFATELKRFTSRCNEAKLYRVGGDDFVVVVDTKDLDSVKMMAKETIKNFQKKGISYRQTTLIDISLVAGITQTKPYLETADLALKEAKRSKNLSMVAYTKQLDKSHIVEKNINAVKMLKEGIANDRFFPQFQPIVDLQTGKVTKYEALIRLKKADGQTVYPNSFIEEAKDSKLLNRLTRIMLIKSFEVFKHVDCNFSINISFSEIIDEKNQDEIIKIIDEYGRHSKKLTLEILEDDAIDDYQLLDRFLSRVQKFGVDIAIDDFGSGYSNFGHIISMNTHFLKIDGSLIKIVDYDVQARVLVKSIVDFARSMQIKTVAEFVHSQDVLDMVKRLGIDYAQGFYLGKPADTLQNLECGYKV